MRSSGSRCIAVVALALVLATGSTRISFAEEAARIPASAGGQFTLLTYNVAGLPLFVSQSNPVANMPVISDLLNLYDVAVVQEDFAYHQDLISHARHGYRMAPLPPSARDGIGDGLGEFSRIPFVSPVHVAWRSCHGRFEDGADCLAPKGFTVSTHELAPGVLLDVYNVHFDSGGSVGDVGARAAQADQLADYVQNHSAEHAVIVAGDTNMRADERSLERLLSSATLSDACRVLSCPNPGIIDRVMYRGSDSLRLRASKLEVDRRFVGKDGRDLSDHKAVGVVFRWATNQSRGIVAG